jgi:membrane-associated phospholipid phosphatase
LAFALATPFAQQYNMPWLYAAAATTALGRVQQRQHWVSDTVAGGLLGYAVGSLVQQGDQAKNSPRITVLPQRVQADWSF